MADSADVSVRTIRYYIHQGLIPPPEARGPLTRYSAGHLARVQLIKYLQQGHLPLAEIRRQLEVLDDAAVHRALTEAPKKKRPHSAAAYVREVLAGSGRDGRPMHATPPGEDLAGAPVGVYDAITPPPTTPESRSTWERIALSPDIELHVRRPLSREQNRQLERLLDAARHLMVEDQ